MLRSAVLALSLCPLWACASPDDPPADADADLGTDTHVDTDTDTVATSGTGRPARPGRGA